MESWPEAEGSSAHFLSSQKVDRKNPWGRSPWLRRCESQGTDSQAASPSPADGPSGSSKRRAFTHSGGTAPDLHRLPRYAPRGHPRQVAMLAHLAVRMRFWRVTGGRGAMRSFLRALCASAVRSSWNGANSGLASRFGDSRYSRPGRARRHRAARAHSSPGWGRLVNTAVSRMATRASVIPSPAAREKRCRCPLRCSRGVT